MSSNDLLPEYAGFDDAILYHIASFLNSNEVILIATVSKRCTKIANDVSTMALKLMATKRNLNVEYEICLAEQVQACKREFYFPENNIPLQPRHTAMARAFELPTLPPRLLWQASRIMPMEQLAAWRRIGPSVVLPNQNIAMVSRRRGDWIYILDTKTSRFREFHNQIDATPAQLGPGGILFYSKGHLVLFALRHSGVHVLYVWKVTEDSQGNVLSIDFLYRHLKFTEAFNRHEESADVVVADNGKVYLLGEARRRENEGPNELIQVFDVPSGSLLNTIDMGMQNNTSFIRRRLLLSDNHLLLIRSRPLETEGPFPIGDLGIRAFALVENDLVETSFLPGFRNDGAASLNMDTSKQTKTLILYRKETDAVQFNRMISINGDGILQEEAGVVNFRTRYVVKHKSSSNRVFVANPDHADGIIKLDEYDIATDTKVRTLWTGLPHGNYSIQSVHSTEQAVFLFISSDLDDENPDVIQSFVL